MSSVMTCRGLQAPKPLSDKKTGPQENAAPALQREVQIWTINAVVNSSQNYSRVRKGKQAFKQAVSKLAPETPSGPLHLSSPATGRSPRESQSDQEPSLTPPANPPGGLVLDQQMRQAKQASGCPAGAPAAGNGPPV